MMRTMAAQLRGRNTGLQEPLRIWIRGIHDLFVAIFTHETTQRAGMAALITMNALVEVYNDGSLSRKKICSLLKTDILLWRDFYEEKILQRQKNSPWPKY
jgi:hypothetical protein